MAGLVAGGKNKKAKKEAKQQELLKQTWDTELEEQTQDGNETIRDKGFLDGNFKNLLR